MADNRDRGLTVADDDEGGGASPTTAPAAGTSTATDVSLLAYWSALRTADFRFGEERDRRYREVDKARRDAEEEAKRLARACQTYKDKQANDLRHQIASERGSYATRDDLTAAVARTDGDLTAAVARIEAIIAPIAEWRIAEMGREGGVELSGARQRRFIAVSMAAATLVLAAVVFITNLTLR